MPFQLSRLPRRIYRVGWGDDPLAYAPLAILQNDPGRWDDMRYRFRTGYFADSLFTCFVEVLAGLRPDPAVVNALRAMGEPLPNMDVAIAEAMVPKFASVVITQEDHLVDIVHAQSREEFRIRARRRTQPKVGDFLATLLRAPRRAAGLVYDAGYPGICAPSAEASTVDVDCIAATYNIFETRLNSNEARVVLVRHTVRPAAEQTIDIASARDFLGLWSRRSKRTGRSPTLRTGSTRLQPDGFIVVFVDELVATVAH